MAENLTSIVIIPSRLQAQRFPRKPLASIMGKPMILHVLEEVMKSGLSDVVVAAGDLEIKEVVEHAGFLAVSTDPNHPSGSDRVCEAINIIDPYQKKEIIINVQGDLPVFDARVLKDLIRVFENPNIDIATPVTPFKEGESPDDPNRVKVAVSWRANKKQGRALYFSRSKIPYKADPYYHHIGIYAYRRKALENFISLPVCSLEVQENLEQLRALAAGMWIEVVDIDQAPLSVDTLEDLKSVEAYLREKKEINSRNQ